MNSDWKDLIYYKPFSSFYRVGSVPSPGGTDRPPVAYMEMELGHRVMHPAENHQWCLHFDETVGVDNGEYVLSLFNW